MTFRGQAGVNAAAQSVPREQSIPRTHRPDYAIALIVAVLVALGLIILYSVSPILSHKLTGSVDRNYYFLNQMQYAGLGLIVWAAVSIIPYWRWRRWVSALLGVAVLAQLALFVPGLAITINGATRWVDLGFTSFQPAELLKIAVILYLAAWVEQHRAGLRTIMDGLVPYGLILAAACMIIAVFQRDMGTMMVLMLAGLGMYYASATSLLNAGLLFGSFAAAGVLMVAAFPHRMERLMTFLNPTKDPTNTGYHINQALIAVGSGGLFGLGLGKSLQVYGYLPEAANDSIFAIIAEEFGLLGSILVLALFAALALRGLRVASKAPDMFSRLAATGISLWLFFQALINIGAMLSILPLTGIPLPFISFGGTSLIFCLVGAGILLNISKYTIREGNDEGGGNRWRVRRAHNADSRGRRVAESA